MPSEEQKRHARYKLLLVAPLVLLAVSAVVLVVNFTQTGEWFIRSVELKGGTQIILQTAVPADLAAVRAVLAPFGEVELREVRGSSGFGLVLQMAEGTDTAAVEAAIRTVLTPLGVSVQQTGPALGQAFWVQAQIGFVLAFVLMSIVIFLVYRIPVPSLLVIVTVFADIVTVMAFMLVFHVELTLATFAALLMLVGYSVDTDILQTTRFLKGEGGSGADVMRGSIKTVVTMTLTTMVAMAAVVLTSISGVISEIALVLLIGLAVDIIYTYGQNAVLLRWYAEKRGMVS